MLDTLHMIERYHPFYRNLDIIDINTLNRLLENGFVFDPLWSVEEDIITRVDYDQGPHAAAGEEEEVNDDNVTNMVSEGLVPDITENAFIPPSPVP